MKRPFIARLPIAAVALALGLSLPLPAADTGDAPAAWTAEADRLHRELQPGTPERWQELPWQLSLLAARERALEEGKPVYMLVRSGHPLGCV